MSMGEISTGILSVVIALCLFFAVRKVAHNFSSGGCGCHETAEKSSGCSGCQGCARQAREEAHKGL